jgi:glyoxylase-like metal-dependent hydrolase (beta-lactamase superfamily II)
LLVVDPHVDFVDDYVALAEAQGAAIVAVFDTHLQADHVSGLPRPPRAPGREKSGSGSPWGMVNWRRMPALVACGVR